MRYHPQGLASLCTLVLALVACEGAPPTTAALPSHAAHPIRDGTSGTESSLGPVVRRQLAELRRATARYRRFEVATEAGYATQLTGCMSDPAGGMGFHYGNVALIDARVQHDRPEILMYEPQKNGSLRLVGVEFVVPFTAWTAAEPPALFGRPFHRNEAFGLWVLHAWVWKHNPSGLFSDWNPRVTCAFAR